MSTGEQLALDLPHRTAFGRDAFLVAACNADAVAWVDRWPDWPSGALAVYGPAGCGKTHLATVWQARADARLVAAQDLAAPDDVAGAGAVVVDGADAGVPDAAFKAFLDLHRARGGSVMLTARVAPGQWAVALPDLASRLRALPAVAILPPDAGLLAAVLVKHCADRQLVVPPEVVAYVVSRIERTFEATRTVVAALDSAGLRESRAITIALVRRVLAGLGASAG